MSARVEIYRDAYRGRPARLDLSTEKPHVLGHKGKWRWRFVKNGRVMADSGQGYSRRIDALNGCAAVLGGYANPGDGNVYRLDLDGEVVLVHDLTREVAS
jgi:uncharacterized protein YegP (UPF0339 family)